MSTLVKTVGVLYLCSLVTVWSLIWHAGDRFWWGTLLVFGPRWAAALPLTVLIPATLVWHRRSLWLCLLACAVCFGPIMGFNLPWHVFDQPAPDAVPLRVVTWNLGNCDADPAVIAFLLGRYNADVAALQECQPGFAERLGEFDWRVPMLAFREQRERLVICSRYPIDEVDTVDRRDFGGWGNSAMGCRLYTPAGTIAFVNLHLMTPRSGIEELLQRNPGAVSSVRTEIQRRAAESRAVRRWISGQYADAIVAGDFNMPVKSRIYQEDWSSLQNAFSNVGWGYGYTKLTRWHGVRIDHILAPPCYNLVACEVGRDSPSDHRPVIAQVAVP
ncbi:MAG: endonuclease/exonuclease/phosphatase family protein [Thermoguttaceae bacterium]